MIVSVSDILNVLKQVPEWLQLNKLPKEIEELKRMVSRLEEEISKRPSLDTCPLCNKG